MRRKSLKCAAMAAVAGTMLQLGGCDLGGLVNQAFIGAVRQVGADTIAPLLNVGDLLGGLGLGGSTD